MTEVISVRFRGGCKNYYFDPKGVQVKMGDQVIVETAQGPEFATCTQGNHEVEDSAIVRPLCAMLRMATDSDRRTVEYNRKKESEAFDICERKIAEHGLEMKLVNVSASFDGNKIIFYFTADGRVDFRELGRDLASVFRGRIELRQIGVRDEAKMIGGLGICGRPFCCSQFLDGFLPVSIKMAKTQNLSLNPTKISGTCGRLMCCLKYEQNAYEDAAKRMPKVESFVQTPDGPGNVKSVDLLRETMKVNLDSAGPNEPLKTYHSCEPGRHRHSRAACPLCGGEGRRGVRHAGAHHAVLYGRQAGGRAGAGEDRCRGWPFPPPQPLPPPRQGYRRGSARPARPAQGGKAACPGQGIRQQGPGRQGRPAGEKGRPEAPSPQAGAQAACPAAQGRRAPQRRGR